MQEEIKEQLGELYRLWSGENANTIVPLPESGSYRKYFRLISKNKKALGVFNSDQKENIAFLEFTKEFLRKSIPVPKIYKEYLVNNIYLIEDLGDETLYSVLCKKRNENGYPKEVVELLKTCLEELVKIQLEGGKDLDYSNCYPRKVFDKQSIMWDLWYFKYYFLKLCGIPFQEQKLEDDFNKFADYLLSTESKYFLYRDFQSRNIMIYENKPYFIDYQGGRKGALQYDPASLLYDAKADFSNELREELLQHYINTIQKHTEIRTKDFADNYYAFALIRIMQAMGAYGFRGLYEGKKHFVSSIPFALKNLEYLLNNFEIKADIPYLMDVLKKVAVSEKMNEIISQSKLTVNINSFSFKKGVPQDISGNGGGFVFDCRALHNPGRYEEYKHLTGCDKEVVYFLEEETEVAVFFSNLTKLVEQSVEKYTERGFSSLMVNFGCTGGQHRSVYCAEKLSKYLKKKYDINVIVRHREQE